MNQATNHPALLVELLTEELPPHALTRLADSFAQGIRTRLATLNQIGRASCRERV